MATAQQRKNAQANRAYIESAKKYAHQIERLTMKLLSDHSKRSDKYFTFRDLGSAINYQLRLPDNDIVVDVEAFLRERFKQNPYADLVDMGANGIRIKPNKVNPTPVNQTAPAAPAPVVLEPVMQVEEISIQSFSQKEICAALQGDRFFAIAIDHGGERKYVGPSGVGNTPRVYAHKGHALRMKEKYAKDPAHKGASIEVVDIIAPA